MRVPGRNTERAPIQLEAGHYIFAGPIWLTALLKKAKFHGTGFFCFSCRKDKLLGSDSLWGQGGYSGIRKGTQLRYPARGLAMGEFAFCVAIRVQTIGILPTVV